MNQGRRAGAGLVVGVVGAVGRRTLGNAALALVCSDRSAQRRHMTASQAGGLHGQATAGEDCVT